MSQAKVDKYKKEKANRKKEMAKQKTEKIIGIICGCAILVAIVGWAGYTGYNYYEEVYWLFLEYVRSVRDWLEIICFASSSSVGRTNGYMVSTVSSR